MAVSARLGWRDLLRLREWMPLAAVPVETVGLSENVRKIEAGKYLVVVESNLVGEMAHGPYVTMVAWAESDGAAVRAIDGALEADKERTEVTPPPDELLPEVGAAAYVPIIGALKKKGEPVLESGEYRIGSDGAFLHKVIRSSCAAYYFRSPEPLENEAPFSITHRIARSR